MSFLDRLDYFSEVLSWLAKLVLLVLVSAMLYEVVARYWFNQPTLWAFDISYMLNGSLFLLGAGYTLKADAHVRIDFLSSKLPATFQQRFNGVVYVGILGPIFITFAWVATSKALRAFERAEVESVSPWAPLMWPFYAVIALGLWVLALQCVIEGVRFYSGQKVPGSAVEKGKKKRAKKKAKKTCK